MELTAAIVGWMLTLVLAVVGWMVAAVISAKDRKRAFRLEVLEHARREVIPKISAYQEWVGEVAIRLTGLNWIRIVRERQMFGPAYVQAAWRRETEALGDVLARGHESLRLFGTLEDYEVVFPQTREVRLELVGFHQRLSEFAYGVHRRLLASMPTGLIEDPHEVDLSWFDLVAESVSAFYDMQAVTQDIRVGIQNVALSKVFDSAVPDREPLDATVPLVVTSGQSWSIRNQLPALPSLDTGFGLAG